jgi:ribonuclease Z
MKRAAAMIVILVAVTGLWAWNSETGQDWLLEKAVTAGMKRTEPMTGYDGLKVFFCGTSSPLPAPGRAQACVAVLAGEALYLVDVGAGSNSVANLGFLPMARLEAIFITHFHSDHIAEIYEFNLTSWVAGRPEPMTVFGPKGVAEVIDGLNMSHRQDRSYRVDHHGPELLPPELGVIRSQLMEPGTTIETGDLVVTSFVVNHDPVHPAVGYRFDYEGRSVVISGDTVVTPELIAAADGADLLLQDALSLPVVRALENATPDPRMKKILSDIQDYHAHTSDMSRLVEKSRVRQLALYHLVPAPRNALFEKIFLRDVPDSTVLAEDGMVFELPAGNERVIRIDP